MEKTAIPVIPADRTDDLHNLDRVDEADLILFMAGNQFMVMAEIVAEFQKRCPDIANIYYETLPPGLELKQILSGGARFQDRVIDVYPDVYSSVSVDAMHRLASAGHIGSGDHHLYLHNRLSLMVAAGNPAGVNSVTDLGRDAIRISQPDPANEDIAFHIMDMYRQAGGDALVHRIMEEKRAAGTTIMTIVHHRETPLRIRKKTADVGPVWATEIINAKEAGLACDAIEPGKDYDQRDRINYYICRLQRAPHPENAQRFVEFILSPAAQRIYARFGFVAR
jgi:ABC-type molybdate transport system substrate-binding protein